MVSPTRAHRSLLFKAVFFWSCGSFTVEPAAVATPTFALLSAVFAVSRAGRSGAVGDLPFDHAVGRARRTGAHRIDPLGVPRPRGVPVSLLGRPASQQPRLVVRGVEISEVLRIRQLPPGVAPVLAEYLALGSAEPLSAAANVCRGVVAWLLAIARLAFLEIAVVVGRAGCRRGC